MERPRRVLWLAVLLCLGIPALSSPASAHPFHLMIDNPVVVTPDAVYDTGWVAQSVVPTADFVVTRISLYVLDKGSSDALSVWVRDCCIAGLPGSTILANGSADGPPVAGWLDVDVVPRATLVAGQTY